MDPTEKRLPISACYIVKNEEAFLKASLSSVCDWVSELILLDSGSTDRTLKIAEEFRGRVPSFNIVPIQWLDDFSIARNQALMLVKQPWALFIDGDEILDASAPAALEMAISQNEIGCFSLIQRNYTAEANAEECKPAPPGTHPLDHYRQPLFYFENPMERLVRKSSGIVYEGRIHESLLPSCRKLNVSHAELPVRLHHYGRLKNNLADKLPYYLSLSEKKWQERPHDAAAWIELATNLSELGDHARAFAIANEAFAKFPDERAILKIFFQTALRAEKYTVAEDAIKKYLEAEPSDVYALSQLTNAFLYQKKFADVLDTAEQVFDLAPDDFVAHVNTAVVFFEQQDWFAARLHLEIAHRLRPEDPFINSALAKLPR